MSRSTERTRASICSSGNVAWRRVGHRPKAWCWPAKSRSTGMYRAGTPSGTPGGHHASGECPRYVSRGGEKLAAALAAFALDIRQRVAMDVGASTGGFTDCLLQAGAVRVYAVDVGYGPIALAFAP